MWHRSTAIKTFLIFTLLILFAPIEIGAQIIPMAIWNKASSGGGGGGASSLEFVTQPYHTFLTGVVPSWQPQVAVVDSSGNILSTATDSVTLSAYTNSTCTTAASGTLAATNLTQAATSGVATFAGLKYTTSSAEVIYVKAASGSLTSACSRPIAVLQPITKDASVVASATNANSVTTPPLTLSGPNEYLMLSVGLSNTACSASFVSGATLNWYGNTFSSIAVTGLKIDMVVANAATAFSNKAFTITLNSGCNSDIAATLTAYKNVQVNSSPIDSLRDIPYQFPPTISDTTGADYSALVASIIATTPIVATAPNVLDASTSTSSNSLYHAVARNPNSTTSGTSNQIDFTSPSSATGTIAIPSQLKPALPTTSIPTFDQSVSVENVTGSTNSYIEFSTTDPNELLLLAVSWRNTSAMTTAPTGGPGNWTPVGSTIVQGTVSTQLYRTLATTLYYRSSIMITWPGGAKGSAVLATFRGINTTGTFGSGAVDVVATGSNSTANPSVSVTTATANSLVVSFASFGNDVSPTVSNYWTLSESVSSSGGGGATGKSTTAFQIKNSYTATAGKTVTPTFTHAAIDWTMHTIAIKP